MTEQLGTAYVTIEPDTSGLLANLERGVEEAASQVKALIPIQVDSEALTQQLEAISQASGGIKGLEVDTTESVAELEKLETASESAVEAEQVRTSVMEGAADATGTAADATTAAQHAINRLRKTSIAAGQSLRQTLIADIGSLNARLSRLGIVGRAAGSVLQTSIANPRLAIGIAGLVGAATKGVHTFQEVADEVKELKAATGASAEESSKLRLVFEALGVSSQSATMSLRLMSRSASGSGERFRKLGIDIARTSDGNIDVTETFLNVADAVKNSTSAAQQTTIAMSALGRGGQRLLPVLRQGREGLKEFFETAEGRKELIFNDKDLKMATEFKITMRELKTTAQEVFVPLGRAALPVLSAIAETFEKIPSPVSTTAVAVVGASLAIMGLSKAISFVKTTVLLTALNKLRTSAVALALSTELLGGGWRNAGKLLGTAGKDAARSAGSFLAANKLMIGAAAAATIATIAFNKASNNTARDNAQMADELATVTIPTLIRTGDTLVFTARDMDYLSGGLIKNVSDLGDAVAGVDRQSMFTNTRAEQTAEVFKKWGSNAINSGQAINELGRIAGKTEAEVRGMFNSAVSTALESAVVFGKVTEFGRAAHFAFEAGATTAEQLAIQLKNTGKSQDVLNGYIDKMPNEDLKIATREALNLAFATEKAAASAEAAGSQIVVFAGMAAEAFNQWRRSTEEAINPLDDVFESLLSTSDSALSQLASDTYDVGAAADSAAVSYENAADEVIVFGNMTRSAFKDWRIGTIDAINPVNDVLGRLGSEAQQATDTLATGMKNDTDHLDEMAEAAKITAAEVLKAFQAEQSRLEDYGENWERLLGRNLPASLVQHLQEMGIEGAGVVEALAGANSEEFKNIIKTWEESQAVSAETSEAITDHLPPISEAAKETARSIGNSAKSVGRSQKKLRDDADITADEILDAFRTQSKSLLDYSEDWESLIARGLPENLTQHLQSMGIKGARIVEALADANDAEFNEIITLWSRAEAQSSVTADAVVSDFTRASEELGKINWDAASAGAVEAFSGLEDPAVTAAEAIVTAFEAAANELSRINWDQAAAGVEEAFSGLDVSSLSSGNVVLNVDVEPRRHGGPVAAGQAYRVGEEGPELFVPDTGGQIITAKDTASMMSGGVTQNITVNEVAQSPEATARAIAARLGEEAIR